MRQDVVVTLGLCCLSLPTCGAQSPVLSARSAAKLSYALPPVQTTWSYNIGGSNALNAGATPSGRVISLDLYGVGGTTIRRLRQAGKYVVCYYSAGSSESYRTDAASRRLLDPTLNLGEVRRGEDDVWAGERWLDLRGFSASGGGRAAVLRDVMGARLDLARQKGCDAVEPDNVDAWDNVVNQNAPAGTPAHAISAADQLAYNRWTAVAAHARGLAALLKNDLAQIPDLVTAYDGALNEECFDFIGDCEQLAPFRDIGKAIYVVLYHPAAYATPARAQVAGRLHLNVLLTDPDVTRTEPYARFGAW